MLISFNPFQIFMYMCFKIQSDSREVHVVK